MNWLYAYLGATAIILWLTWDKGNVTLYERFTVAVSWVPIMAITIVLSATGLLCHAPVRARNAVRKLIKCAKRREVCR